jgi:hypothetical protein
MLLRHIYIHSDRFIFIRIFLFIIFYEVNDEKITLIPLTEVSTTNFNLQK